MGTVVDAQPNAMFKVKLDNDFEYMLFYVAFTVIFYLTDRNVPKTLLLIILIYLF